MLGGALLMLAIPLTSTSLHSPKLRQASQRTWLSLLPHACWDVVAYDAFRGFIKFIWSIDQSFLDGLTDDELAELEGIVRTCESSVREWVELRSKRRIGLILTATFRKQLAVIASAHYAI